VVEEHLRESARGRADVETDTPFGVKTELLERGRNLDAAS